MFSIITVCFNSEKTIEKTIKSVLKQGIDDYEYIIIDGKSTDNTLKIVEKYRDQFGDKIKVISEKDNGIYDAMNKGIRISKGELLGFINSDDYYEDNALKIIKEKVSIQDEYIYGDTKLTYYFKNNTLTRLDCPREDISEKSLQMGMGFIHQSSFVRREVFSRVGMFNTEFVVGADWDFTIRCLKQGVKFKKYNIVISVFSKDGVSSKSHIIERHNIRKNNKLYRWVDVAFIKDVFNFANIIQNIFGNKTFEKAREFYHLKIKGI